MNEKEFHALVSKEPFQVFFLKSRMSFPFIFAVHTWVVTVHQETVDRWEVHNWKNPTNALRYGHIHYNTYKPWQGMRSVMKEILPNDIRFQGRLIAKIEGKENSLAYRIIAFVENSAKKYPLSDSYRFYPGPNCNTYTQWILDAFPECPVRLPFGAMGKKFSSKYHSKKSRTL